MLRGDRDRTTQAGPTGARSAPTRRGANPVLALQRAVGNRGTTGLLARRTGSRGTFENSVQIGKLGPIEITDSNVSEWVQKRSEPDTIVVTSVPGKHSAQLKRLSDDANRIELVQFTAVSGENSWTVLSVAHSHITGYAADPSGKSEQWALTGFDAVNRARTSIGVPRP